ncbi:PucR family transcriptional regulator [Neobacillus niacini]|uniref:PucR family transcriptional regulator n=1 Tax=Neobacillus niacini TaxID=86668 RepID=UPI003000B7F1
MEKIDLGNCYRIVFEELAQGGGEQSIVDALFAYTKMPIHVVDISFNVIAASFDITTGSPHLDEMIDKKIVPLEVVIGDYCRLGYLELLEKHQKSVVVDWGVIEVPQASSAIRINGHIAGLCATTFSDQEQALDALEVNDILCKALAIEFERRQRAVEQTTDPIHQVLTRELFRDLLPEQEQKGSSELLYSSLLHPGYQMAVITSIVPNNTRFQYVRKAIMEEFPEAFHLDTGEYLYLLMANLPSGDAAKNRNQTMGELMGKYQCYCGLSGVFDDLSKRSNFRLRAQKELEVGHAIHPDEKLYFFDDYYLEILASYAAEGLGEAGYALPELEKLREIDRKKGTDYYYTLKTHLVLGNNINLTAAKLHIHRNTLVYRLAKIEEVTEVDINDEEVIRRLMAAMTLKYVTETVHHHEIPASPQNQDFWARQP